MKSDTEALVSEAVGKHPGAGRDSLIPLLQEIQETLGYLSRDSIIALGKLINLPDSKIYGVATFYNQFRFEPRGRFHVQVCRGTACHVKGSVKVLDAIKKELGIESGRTTRDGLFSLEIVACMGACALAPVVSINGEFHARVVPEMVAALTGNCRRQASGKEA